MTPFHIVATSANLRVDVLQCLMDSYPREVMLSQKDANGKTMLDYLLLNQCSNAIPAIQLLLEGVFSNNNAWGQAEWNQDLLQQLEALEQHNIGAFHQRLVHCMKQEMTSLIELSLWKKDLGNETTDRQACRSVCGAEVVVKSVVPFLWENASNSDSTLLFNIILP